MRPLNQNSFGKTSPHQAQSATASLAQVSPIKLPQRPTLIYQILRISLTNTIIIFLLLTSYAYAEDLTSPSFRIHMSTINITGGQKTGGGFKLSDTVGQTAQGLFSTTGFRVRAGFQYVHGTVPFSFKIDNLAISFGSLSLNTLTNATNTLTVTAGGAYGYAVKAIENAPLTLVGGVATIPNTTCDPALACAINDATPWTVTTSYGFGYNMSGNDVDTVDFVNGTYFRPFANNAASESPVTVMSNSGITRSSVATVTYQINVSATQAAGSYQNAIQYIAIPAY